MSSHLKLGSNNEELPEAGWKRHPELYFSDGTIIFVVESVAFRVYHGLLSSRSEVFNDMIAIGGPSTSGDGYDGCPIVVHLHGDLEEEFTHFIKATMGIHNFYGPGTMMSIRAVAAILRLSHKYVVSNLRQWALKYFEERIPIKFEEIDEKAPENLSRIRLALAQAVQNTSKVNLISIFRECCLDQFLPWLFYELAVNYTAVEIMGLSFLDQEDKIHLIGGKEKLQDAFRKNVWKIVTSYDPRCLPTKDVSCGDTLRLRWLEGLTLQNKMMWLRSSPFIEELQNRPSLEPAVARLLAHIKGPSLQPPCQGCSTYWIQQSKRWGQETWVQLPKMFGLSDWETLKKSTVLKLED